MWDVNQLLRDIPSPMLSEWMAFAKLEPFGFDVDMYGHGITASTIANVNRRKGAKAFQPDDFIPKEKQNITQGSFFANLKTFLMLNKNGKNKDKK